MATTVGNGAETVNSGSSTEGQQSAVSNVQSQIDTLADLCKRLQTLRQLPGGVLRSDLISGPNQVLQTLTLKDIFGKSSEDLRTLHAAAIEGKVQDALRTAAESERRDGNDIRDFRERENQKRRCVHQALALFFFFLRVFLPFPAAPGSCADGAELTLCIPHITVVLPPPSPLGHICLYSRRLRTHFLRFQRAHYRSRSKTCRHTSGSLTPHMRRGCFCTFTWRPGTSHAASPFL